MDERGERRDESALQVAATDDPHEVGDEPPPARGGIERRRPSLPWLQVLLGDEFWPAIRYADLSDSQWVPSHWNRIISVQFEHVRWAGDSPDFEPCTNQHLRGILERLTEAPYLSTLRLDSTCATDADMYYVAKLDRLEILDLQDTRVTDDGLKRLRRLQRLRELYLFDSKVTRHGVEQCRRSMPGCCVYWHPPGARRYRQF